LILCYAIGMAADQPKSFEPVVALLRQTFAGSHGVAHAFWHQHLVERLSRHPLTPSNLRQACVLLSSYSRAESYVLDAKDLQDAWSRSLELYAATNQLLAWASELNLIDCTSRKT